MSVENRRIGYLAWRITQKSMKKLKEVLLRIRFKPIHVFVFHQVSDEFDPDGMWECDWSNTEVFKHKILALKSRYSFIPLEEAYHHISKDTYRIKSYASLTTDDGWASLKNILPWLAEQQIPVTLFVNPKYMDGEHYQIRKTEQFLTTNEVSTIINHNAPLFSIGSHGWAHDDCTTMTFEQFTESVGLSESFLKGIKRKIPFYAFTFGRYTREQKEWLLQQHIVPVLVDTTLNYNDSSCIHRECIDVGKKLG